MKRHILHFYLLLIVIFFPLALLSVDSGNNLCLPADSDSPSLLLLSSDDPDSPSEVSQSAKMIKTDAAIIVSPGLNTDNGMLFYTDEYGKYASELGIDVSFYNNNIDWKAVKQNGIDFVIVRLGGRGWGSGLRYHDSKTLQYLRGARDAGLKIGAYYYSTAKNQNEAREEASDALAVINGFKLDLPIYIDMEYSGDYPDGRADLISPAQKADIADAFIDQIEDAGYRGGIYSAQSIFQYDYDYPAVSCFPVWLASYTNNNQLPGFAGNYDLWQFTDAAQIGGVDGPVDLNVKFKD